MANITEIVYTWPDGRQEVRYRRTTGCREANRLTSEVVALQRKHGEQCPYSIRFVPPESAPTVTGDA